VSLRLCSSKTSDDSKLQNLHCSMLGDQNQFKSPPCLVSSALFYVYRLSKSSHYGLDVLLFCLCRSKASKASEYVSLRKPRKIEIP
jgi:hypothetical protein